MEERHVVTCFLVHEGKVALLRRSSQVGTYQGRWAGVSGYLEQDATPYAQALQELREETGLSGSDIKLKKEGEILEVVDEELGRKWIVHPFRFELAHPQKIKLDWEHQELRWVEPKEISSLQTVPMLKETWDRVA